MKTKLFFLNIAVLCTAILFSVSLDAQTWRVNNQSDYDGSTNFGENYGGTPSFPVFKEINDAVASPNVMAGDTLHIEGSTIPYAIATITKRLTIIGPGYFLTENEKVSNNTYDAKVGSLTFNSGSEFSQVIGMNILGGSSSSSGKINCNVSNITIKRCRIDRYIYFNTGLNGFFVLQNFFTDEYDTDAFQNSTSSAYIPPQDVIFNNNICQKRLVWSGSWGEGTLLECNNNVFDGPEGVLSLEFNTGSFQNNILKATGMTANINSGTNNNVQYNTVQVASVFDGTLGNEWVPDMDDLFVQNSTTDGNYQLQEGVSSNVPGSDGADRGAFGGVVVTNRYNLSGLGAIPVVYEVSTTGTSEPGNQLPVTIKARTNN